MCRVKTGTRWHVVVLLCALACSVAVGEEEKRQDSDDADRPNVQLSIRAGKIESDRFCVRARLENAGKKGLYVLAIGHDNDWLDIRDSEGKKVKPLSRGFVFMPWFPSPKDYVFLRPGDVFETTWEYQVSVMELPNEDAGPTLADNGDKKHAASRPSARCIVFSNTLYPIPEKKYRFRIEHSPGASQIEWPDGEFLKSAPFEEYLFEKQLSKVIVSNWIELDFGDAAKTGAGDSSQNESGSDNTPSTESVPRTAEAVK